MLEEILPRGEYRMPEPWSSVEEIADHLGVVRETVYRWIEQKGLPAHRIGNFCKFKISEVDDWIRAGGAANGSGHSAKDKVDEP